MAEEVLRAVHRGSITAVGNTLRAFKGGIDRSVLNEALLRAVFLNRVEIIERLLEEGASPDSQDEESGWSSLHRAFYWGHMHAAALLLESGAQLNIPDSKGRTALDLLSAELQDHLSDAAVEGEVYTWGNGANYQLGSGAVGLQLAPVRLEPLHEMSVQAVAAAKFHTAAITKDGQLYTWGFGRGGRLGHADFHIHSGQSASILPQQVVFFGRRRVLKVAAAKHHSAAITSAGELFTWGSNRDGRLGYQAVDTQPTPRKITTFNRQKVSAVAVANRHTVALLEGGSVYSWGSNLQGQLGYGTTDSASNATPRVVEALKGKNVKAVAAAKRHTVVLTEDGDVFTWGHQKVTPRRVVLSGSRDVARANAKAASSGGWKVVFHNGQSEVSRPEAVVIAAGAAHSSAVTRDGVVLAWRSMDPALRPQEVGGPLAGKKVVSISAGKYRTAVVTSEGDVYMWEGWSKAAEAVPKRSSSHHVPGTSPTESFPPEWEVPKGLKQQKPGKAQALAFQLITPQRVEGLKRVTGIAVGEKHSIALQSWCAAPIFLDPPAGLPAESLSRAESLLSPRGSAASALEDADIVPRPSNQGSAVQCVQSDAYWDALELAVRARDAPPGSPRRVLRRPGSARREGPTSLQRLCERCVAAGMVEPRTVLQVLEFADAAGAQALKTHCLWVALSNLDVVLLESRGQFEQLLPHVLEEMTQHWVARFSRAVVAPTSPDAEGSSAGPQIAERSPSSVAQPSAERSFRIPREEAEAADRARQERTIRKKLQQIDTLRRRADESPLDSQQQAKLALRPTLLSALQALQSNRPAEEVRRMLVAAQRSEPSTPKSVLPSGGHTEARSGRRRSRSGLSSAGTSPVPTSSVHSPQELASRSLTGVSPTNSESSAVTRYRPTPTRLAMDSSLPDSFPRVSGFEGSSPAPPKWPVPQKGFAEPSTSFPQASASPLSTLHEEDLDKVGLLDSAAARFEARKPSGQASGSSNRAGSSGKKPAKRKGGLSMFLSGQLEQQPDPKPAPPPPQQKASHLTWALQAQKSPLPLREILDSEAAQSTAGSRSSPSPCSARQHQRVSSGGTPRQGGRVAVSGRTGSAATQSSRTSDDGSTASGMTVSLGELVKKSKPIAVSKAAAPERSGPVWGNVPGGSPQTGRTRLQDIQAEQELARESLSRSWGASGASPGSHRGSHYLSSSSTWRLQSGAAGTSPGTHFPAGTSPGSSRRSLAPVPQPQSKWYIKEEQEIVPLRAIQTEESAIKELAALYGDSNVRRVPNLKPPRS